MWRVHRRSTGRRNNSHECRVNEASRLDIVRKRWFSRRAVLLHLQFMLLILGCLTAGWWQATRALAGNDLSWAYTVEWPVFALIAIAAWWHLIHEDPEVRDARKRHTPRLENAERKAEW